MTALPLRPSPPTVGSDVGLMGEIALGVVHGRGVLPTLTVVADSGTDLVFDSEVPVDDAAPVRVAASLAFDPPQPEALDGVGWSRREFRVLARAISDAPDTMTPRFRAAALAYFDHPKMGGVKLRGLDPLVDRRALEHGSDCDVQSIFGRVASEGPGSVRQVLSSLELHSYSMERMVLGEPLQSTNTAGRAVVFASSPVYRSYWSSIGRLRDRPNAEARRRKRIQSGLEALMERKTSPVDYQLWHEGVFPDPEARFGARCPSTLLYGAQRGGSRRLIASITDALLPDRFQALWPTSAPTLPSLSASTQSGAPETGTWDHDPVIQGGILPALAPGTDHHAVVALAAARVRVALEPACREILEGGISVQLRSESAQDVLMGDHQSQVASNPATDRHRSGSPKGGKAKRGEFEIYPVSAALMRICLEAAIRAALAGPRQFRGNTPIFGTRSDDRRTSWLGVPVQRLAQIYLKRLLEASLTPRTNREGHSVDLIVASLSASGDVFGEHEEAILEGDAKAMAELERVLNVSDGTSVEGRRREYPKSVVIRSLTWQVLQRLEHYPSLEDEERLLDLYVRLAAAALGDPVMFDELAQQRALLRRTPLHEHRMRTLDRRLA